MENSTKHQQKIISNYIYKDDEFNLLKMYKETIIKAFDKFKDHKRTVNKVAFALGIGSKQVYRYLDFFEIRNVLNNK